MKKLYDQVKYLLSYYPHLRSSDKALIWAVLEIQGETKNGMLDRESFMNSVAFESITRARRKVQEDFPGLQADERVKAYREDIARQKGTHVYREKIKDYEYVVGEDGLARKVYK